MINSKKKAWDLIIPVIILTLFFSYMIPTIVMDNEIKNYIPHKLASYKTLEDCDEIYGSEILMDLALTSKGNTIITSDNIKAIQNITEETENLEFVDSVQSLSNMDYITSEDGAMTATSLVSEEFTGTREQLKEIQNKIVDWEKLYDKVIISKDFKGTQIILTINKDISPDDMDILYGQIENIVNKYNKINPDLEIDMAGDPVISQLARQYMNTDLSRLIPLVTLVIIICLLLSFKRLEGMLLPLITVLISTVWTVGLMAITNARFTVVSSCLPVVLIAVGSAYGIHVINHYYEALNEQREPLTAEMHRQIVVQSTSQIRFPVILAGITTIAGFISTITSPVVPLKTFAIFSAVGVTISLLLSLYFIPALLMVKPLVKENIRIKNRNKPDKKVFSKIQNSGWQKTFISGTFKYLSARKGRLFIFFAVVLALSIWGISKLNVESAIINYFPEDSEIRQNAKMIDNNFAGTNSFCFNITGQTAGDLTDPEILKQMDEMAIYLQGKYPEIGKIVSFADFIKRMNMVMNSSTEESNNQQFSEDSSQVDSFFSDDSTPDNSVSSFFDDSDIETEESSSTYENSNAMLKETITVSQMMNLFDQVYANAGGSSLSVEEFYTELAKELNYKGEAYDEIPYDIEKYPVETKEELKNLISQYLLLYSGSLDSFIDDPLQPKMAKMQIQLTTHETKVVNNIIEDANNYAQSHFPAGYTLQAYGIAELESSLTNLITQSQITSLALAILIVFIIIAIYFHSPIAGLIGAVPLVISILINFGLMGLLNINLDMVTSIIGSIAIGIGVDYTIHFMDDYHNQRLLCTDTNQVTLRTLSVSGKAIVVNAVSVGLGFLVLSLSQFVVLRYIGILVAIVMLTSSVTAMTILPAMLNIAKPKFISRPLKQKNSK